MRTIAKLGSIAVAFTIAMSAVGHAAPKDKHANKYFTVTGQVLQINRAEHSILVRERSSAKLYLIEMPEGATFTITFGRYMRMREPGFKDVFVNERVAIRCQRNDNERLAQLPDGRSVIALTAAQ